MLHPDLAEALDRLGLTDHVPTMHEAAAHSQSTLRAAEEWLHQRVYGDLANTLDVIVHGSFARGEATGQSDFDYLVVAHGLPGEVRVTRDMLNAIDDFITTRLSTGGDDSSRRPGRTGIFGHIASAPDLTERIGLEQDTNVSTTRRLLVLLESVSIYQPPRHAELLRVILGRYLADYNATGKPGVPRFLLNDVMRYWYTLAVDYQAKRWEAAPRGWGLRYLKLLLSRKLSYSGTLASLLLCDEDRPATVDQLVAEFDKPPLARLAQLATDNRFDQHDSLRVSLEIAETFLSFLADGDLRERARRADSHEGMEKDAQLYDIIQRADALDVALTRVLLDSFLGERARRYLLL